MLSVYETAVNIRWFVVKPRSHFENKMTSKGLSFDEFKKSVESVLCSFQNVKIHELSPHLIYFPSTKFHYVAETHMMLEAL